MAGQQRIWSAFVVFQIAGACILLLGAGLLLRSFLKINAIPIGFDHRNLMTFMVQFPRGDTYMRETGETTPSGSMAVQLGPKLNLVSEQIRQGLASIPGVTSATIAFPAPLIAVGPQFDFSIEGRASEPSEIARPRARWSPVGLEYFKTLGVRTARGRELGSQDAAAATPVVMVNAAAVRKYWPNDDPIGQRIKLDFYNDPPREVVGILDDIKHDIREKEPSPQVYVPYAQLPTIQEARTALGMEAVFFIVRARGDLAGITPAMRRIVSDADPTLAVNNIRTVEEYASLQLLDQRIYVTIITIFGSIALLLSLVGIYAIMAYSVRQRTGEIGIRVALGASSADIFRLILRRGLFLTLIGLGSGMGAGLLMTRVLRTVLWGVTPTDPATFLVVFFSMAAVAMLACWVPARRALRIDPYLALRYR